MKDKACLTLFIIIAFAVGSGMITVPKSNWHQIPADLPPSSPLYWTSFLGGEGTDSGSDIFVDTSGNIFVLGTSSTGWGGAQIINAHAGGKDAFLAKLNSEGELQWVTFIGGTGDDEGNAMEVSGGYIYIVGTSSATWGSPQNAYAGGKDVFLAKYDTSGNRQWNTFAGGSGDDEGKDIVIPSSSFVYIVGSSTASWGSDIRRAYTANKDGFIARIQNTGSLGWVIFLGGTGNDEANALDYSIMGTTIIVGVTGSSNADWGSGTIVLPYRGNWDAFVALIVGGAYQRLAFLGGTGDDFGSAIYMFDTLYVSGDSNANWNWATPKRSFTGGKDAFVANMTLEGLEWHTFLGGVGDDTSQYLNLSLSTGLFFNFGSSTASWGDPASPFTSGWDVYGAGLQPDGTLLYNAFGGGSGDDEMRDVARGTGYKEIYYGVGSSTASWGQAKRAYTAGLDAFIAYISPFHYLYLPLILR